MASKIYSSPQAALDGLMFDGMTIMSGGFGLSGNPESLIPAIRDAGVKGLTIISNNCGADGFGLWMLLNNGQIAKMISSYVGENKLFEQLYMEGKLRSEEHTSELQSLMRISYAVFCLKKKKHNK